MMTTLIYARADNEMKRKAIDSASESDHDNPWIPFQAKSRYLEDMVMITIDQ